jgi:hypothetical protein
MDPSTISARERRDGQNWRAPHLHATHSSRSGNSASRPRFSVDVFWRQDVDPDRFVRGRELLARGHDEEVLAEP